MVERTVNHLGRQLSAEVRNGLPSPKRCREMVEIVHDQISQLSEPVVHGTPSSNLPSILEKGLGGFFPDDSFSPGRISVCSLRYPEGLYGPYSLALRGGVLFNNSDLCIDAREYGGRNIIQRYVAKRGYEKWQVLAAEIKLTFGGARFCLKKRRTNGWPILFFYDAKEVELVQLISRIIEPLPSHFVADKPLSKESLGLMLVPARRIQEAEQIVSGFDLSVPILPMEIIELAEILRTSQCPF